MTARPVAKDAPRRDPRSPERRHADYLERKARGVFKDALAAKTQEERDAEAVAKREKRIANGATPRATRSEVIERRGIIRDAIIKLSAGSSVGVRQMYYWMVTHHPDIISKDPNGYKTVWRDIKAMRENDPEFDWDLIEDGQRTVIEYAIYRKHPTL